MSNISRLTNFGAAGAGGVVDPVVGSVATRSTYSTAIMAHILPYPNSNMFVASVLRADKAVELHLISVDPTTLNVTFMDAMNIGITAFDNRYGVGMGINTANQNHIHQCILDNGGNIQYVEYEINPSGGGNYSIGYVGTTQFGNWSSGYYRPLLDANFFKSHNNSGLSGYFTQFWCTTAGELMCRYVSSTSNNNYSIYSLSGTNRYYHYDRPFTVVDHPNEPSWYVGGLAPSGGNDGQVRAVWSTNTNSWSGGDVWNSPWNNNTSTQFMGLGVDNVNPVGVASGNNKYVHLTKSWYASTPQYSSGLKIFETNNSNSNAYYTQVVENTSLNTNSGYQISGAPLSGGMCGVSGNYVVQADVSSGACQLAQYVWDPSSGFQEVLDIFTDYGSNNTCAPCRGETVVYNPYSGVNLTIYRDTTYYQFYARAFTGRYVP